MPADTSSAPAATTSVVVVAAAALAALSVEPIFARSVAAAVTNSGAAITYAMGHLPPRHDRCVMATQNRLASIGLRREQIFSRYGRPIPGLVRDHLRWEPDRPSAASG